MMHAKKRHAALREPVATAGMERADNRIIQAKSTVTGRKLGGGDDQSPQGTTEACLWYGCLLVHCQCVLATYGVMIFLVHFPVPYSFL
jgi:hypothetical protein